MSTACRACAHQQASEINECLKRGDTLTSVAVKFAISTQSLRQHARNHLNMVGRGETVSSRDLRALKVRIESALDQIDNGTADDILRKQHASLMREHRQVTEKLGSLSGEINSKTVAALLHRLGVHSERELLDIIEERRKMADITVDDLAQDCVKGLKDAFSMKPELREAVRAELYPPKEELEMEG